MKKFIIALLALIVITGCKNQYDIAMKSADKDLILKTANDYFAKKKWAKALPLYERLSNLVAGTDDAPNVVFNSAYANYYDENYRLAGHQFKNFSVTFPEDARVEEAAYMSALCYYEGSMDYNLDQSNTELAINELQNFLNNYPDSERSKNITELIDELMYKLEFKAYENATQYYKMGNYKSANVALQNVLDDFPSTKLRSRIMDYIMKSRYELAMNSVYDLKSERIESAIAYSKLVEKELANSDYAKTAVDLRDKLVKEKQDFAVLQQEREAQIAKLNAKQKALALKQEAKKKTDDQLKEQGSQEVNAKQALQDSAKIATPPPAATFKIQR